LSGNTSQKCQEFFSSCQQNKKRLVLKENTCHEQHFDAYFFERKHNVTTNQKFFLPHLSKTKRLEKQIVCFFVEQKH
jgi:hypothetical protein